MSLYKLTSLTYSILYIGGGYRGRGRGGGRNNYNNNNNHRGSSGPRQPANRFSTQTKSVDPQYAMMKQLTAMIAKMGDLTGAADVANSQNNEESAVVNKEEEKMDELRPVVKAIGTNVSDLVEVLCGVSNAPLFLKFGNDDEQQEQDADGTNDNNKEGSENNGSDNGDNDNMKSETTAEVLDLDEKKPSSSSATTTNNKTINAATEAGGLVTLLLHCSTNLPLQTPSYAALTLGVDVKAPSETHSGFAKRCLELGVRIFGRDLDLALEVCHTTVNNNNSGTSDNNGTKGENEYDVSMKSEEEQVEILKSKEDERSYPAESSGGAGNGKQLDAYYRIKLMLRYFAHLANIGIVAMDGEEGSLLVVLEMLVECASRAAATGSSSSSGGGGNKDEKSRALVRSSQLLASLVLSTIPYISLNQNHRLMELVDALESNVISSTTSNYVSDYDPASGSKSILLKGELDDAAPEGETMDDDDEEEDDDDEEDGGDQPAPCADTLQDLLRTVRKLLLSDSNVTTRFALLDDSPWKALTIDSPEAAEESTAAEGMDVEQSTTTEKVPMSYKGEPLLLDLIGGEEERCKSIPYLLSNDQGEETIEIRCRSLDGIVFGRLSIFDAPPSDDDSDDDDDEEEKKESNPNMEAYTNTYSLIDRFFLSDAVRDVLLCHRPMVSDAGAERNTAKEVAEQIWSISHLFKSSSSPPSTENEGMEESTATPSKVVASKGIEYGIVETLLSLVVQATPTNSSIPSSSPLHSHLYISRVLLELTKLQPTLIPQAIVLATSGMFNDFIPSLTPCARENLGYWFGFHLVNTGYQWPKAYWNHSAPYASTTGGRNSRGEFIKVALTSMASMSSDGTIAVVKDCLPAGSSLVSSVFLSDKDGEEEQDVSSTEKDLIHRMWNTAEDPDTIRQYIIGDELTESASGSGMGKVDSSNSMYHKCVWWRARMAIRALFFPITREKNRIAKATKNASGDNEGGMVVEEEVDDSEDILADMSDALPRFKPVVLAALARDADAYDSIASGKLDDDELLLAGEITILKEVGSLIPSWDITMMNAMLECLMKTGIISSIAITKWALSEHGNDDGSSNGNICNSWWKFVSLAFRNSIRDACSRFEDSKADVGFGIGMIVDNEGQNDVDPAETAAQRLDEALKSAIPILKYVTDRVSQILAASTAEKKIPLASADVSDGMKCLMRALLFHFNSLVLDDSGVLSISNIQKGLTSMDADGEKLGLQCQAAMSSSEGEQGKRLLQSQSLSLEKML